MAKAKSIFVCNKCSYQTPKWVGKCPECGNWNCFDEQITVPQTTVSSSKVSIAKNSTNIAEIIKIGEIDTKSEIRFHTGISEFDRVLGGGIVKGSLILLGGDPGIGKSTLLLQICEYLGKNHSILYVSGEESVRQLKLRANRLSVNSENLYILASTDVETIGNTILQKRPDIVMIDSIQTMCINAIASSPGSITQVRESTNAFMRIAKGEDIPIFIVGHVNKDGAIAGPKVLEH
ncbi:MAG: AAA family ATPase, partial [Oscillospiraceae bacterium]